MTRLVGMLALALIGLAPETALACGQLVCDFWEKPAPHRAALAHAPRSAIVCRESGDLPMATRRLGKVIVVFLCGQHFAAFENNVLRTHGVVSTGMLGYETPPGIYSAIRWEGIGYKSKEYPKPNGGAPMPHAVFFTTDGKAIHGGDMYRPANLHGKPYGMSHGCVRVQKPTAEFLNEWSRPEHGRAEVIVVRDVQEFYELWDRPPDGYGPWQ